MRDVYAALDAAGVPMRGRPMSEAHYMDFIKQFPDTYRRVRWHREQQSINTINRLRKDGYEGSDLRVAAICAGVSFDVVRLADL